MSIYYNSCFTIDPIEDFINTHKSIYSDLYNKLVKEIIKRYQTIKRIEEAKALRKFQKLNRLTEGEMDLFASDILEELKTRRKYSNFIKPVNFNHLTNYYNLSKMLSLVIDEYFINTEFIEEINGVDYIIFSYDNNNVFNENDIKKVIDFYDYKNGKLVEYITRKRFIKNFIKVFDFKIKEIRQKES